jgi:hypothetical protein
VGSFRLGNASTEAAPDEYPFGTELNCLSDVLVFDYPCPAEHHLVEPGLLKATTVFLVTSGLALETVVPDPMIHGDCTARRSIGRSKEFPLHHLFAEHQHV